MTRSLKHLKLPYPGLRPFEESDDAIFFGREKQVGALLRKLEEHRFVAVVGASGSGKSSLVKAGLLPAIRRGFLKETPDWLPIVVRPGAQPYVNLANALLATEVEAGREFALDGPPENFRKLLRLTDNGLLKALPLLRHRGEKNVLLIVDQFEELFTFRRARPGSAEFASRGEAAAFASMLLQSAKDPQGKVWVLLTLRSDFIGDCETFLGLPEAVSQSQFLVPRLDSRQMADAIVRPGTVVTGGFQSFTVSSELVNQMINDAGDRPDQLPLMQHALMRSWKAAVDRATRENVSIVMEQRDYESSGGIEGALCRHANEAWEVIRNDNGRANLCRRLFLLLCDVSSDGQLVRRRPQVVEVESVTGSGVQEIERVVRQFQVDDRNFLLPPLEPDRSLTSQDYLDISHEALLRRWDTYTLWQEEERLNVAELRRLSELARLHGEGSEELLGQRALDRVAKWQKEINPRWASRYVSESNWNAIQEFIQASHVEAERIKKEKEEKAAKQKRQIWTVIIGAAVFSAIISAGLLSWSLPTIRKAKSDINDAKTAQQDAAKATDDAKNALNKAVDFQAERFRSGIAVSNDLLPNNDEISALWELAELDSDAVREKVLSKWFTSVEALRKPLARSGQGLAAVIGISPARLRILQEQASTIAIDPRRAEDFAQAKSVREFILKLLDAESAKKIATDLAKAMENLQKVRPASLPSLAVFIEELSHLMKSDEASAVALRGAKALAIAIQDQSDCTLACDTGNALVLLATITTSPELSDLKARGATSLAALIEKPTTDLADLPKLAAVYVQLATPTDVIEVAKRMNDSMGKREPLDDFAIRAFSKSLGALSKPLNSDDVSLLADGGAMVFAQTMLDGQNRRDPKRIAELGNALSKYIEEMKPNNASLMATDGARVLASTMENGSDFSFQNLADLGFALAELIKSVSDPDTAGPLARSGGIVLTKELENPQQFDSEQLSQLKECLFRLIAQMRSEDASVIAQAIVEAMGKNSPKTTIDQLLKIEPLAESSKVMRLKMPEQASLMAMLGCKALIKIFENPQEIEQSEMEELKLVFVDLNESITPADAKTIAQELLPKIQKPLQNPAQLPRIGCALSQLAKKMHPKDAIPMATSVGTILVEAFEKTQDINSRRELSAALIEFSIVLRDAMRSQDTLPIIQSLADALAEVDSQEQDTDPYRLDNLSTTITELAKLMNSVDVTRIAQQLARTIQQKRETGVRLSELGDAIIGLSTPLNPEHVAPIALELTKELARETNLTRFDILRGVIVDLSTILKKAKKEEAIAPIAQEVATAIETLREPNRVGIHFRLLIDLCDLMTPEDVTPIAERLALKIMNDSGEPGQVRTIDLINGVTELSKVMKPASPVASRVALTIARLHSKNDSVVPAALDTTLFPLFHLIQEDDATSVIQDLEKSLANVLEKKSSDVTQLVRFAIPLAMLSKKSKRENALATATALTKVLENQQVNYEADLVELRGAIVALSRQMTREDVVAVVKQLVKILENPSEKDPKRILNLTGLIAELGELTKPDDTTLMTQEDIVAVAEDVVKIFDSSKETDSVRIRNLVDLTVRLSKAMKSEDATAILVRAASSLANADQPSGEILLELLVTLSETTQADLGTTKNRLSTTKSRLFAISQIMESSDFGDSFRSDQESRNIEHITKICAEFDKQQLAELLKWPFCVGDAETVVLNELQKSTNHEFDGNFWKFIAKAHEFPIKKLNDPAQRPSLEEARDELKNLAHSKALQQSN